MTNRPRLLDLFCGAGGAAMGYHRAGFDVVGVDNRPMPRYPFEFILADALEYCAAYGREYDAIHASPPCQEYSNSRNLLTSQYQMLIGETRTTLIDTGRPYVIENVPGAPLVNPTLLCGLMFGIKTYRHRIFETSFPMPFELHAPHHAEQDKHYGNNRKREYVSFIGHSQYRGQTERACAAMGIDWMIGEELAEAIPPVYTEYIGRYLLAAILERRRD